MSSFELFRGFIKPIDHGQPVPVPLDVLEAHKNFQASRKMKLILRNNAITELPIKIGDSFQVYIHGNHGKRGKWLSPRTLMEYDTKSRTVTVPGARNKLLTAAVEDVRIVMNDDSSSQLVTEAIDKLDESIEDAMTLSSD